MTSLSQHYVKISRPYLEYFPRYKQLECQGPTGSGMAGLYKVPLVTVEGASLRSAQVPSVPELRFSRNDEGCAMDDCLFW